MQFSADNIENSALAFESIEHLVSTACDDLGPTAPLKCPLLFQPIPGEQASGESHGQPGFETPANILPALILEHRRSIQIASCLLFVLAAVVIGLADAGWRSTFGSVISLLPGKDKTVHFFMFGALVIPACLALGMSSFQLGRMRILKGVSLMFGVATIEEVSQLWFTSRTFDWLDLLQLSWNCLLHDVDALGFPPPQFVNAPISALIFERRRARTVGRLRSAIWHVVTGPENCEILSGSKKSVLARCPAKYQQKKELPNFHWKDHALYPPGSNPRWDLNQPLGKPSEGAGARTLDLRIKSPLLYRLSYALNDQNWPSIEGVKIAYCHKSVKGGRKSQS